MAINVHDLLAEYEKIYQERTRDFNALTTVHLSENDHTNILCEILNMKVGNKKPFMESFVCEVLGIDYMDCDKLVAKTQVKSKGNNKIGYIDLLIEGKEQQTRIIIENKVCGACDGHNQLARYYYTYTDVELPEVYKDLESDIINFRKEKNILVSNKENVWIVYLTDITKIDDEKEKTPSEDSIVPAILTDISKIGKYVHISYEEHIYDWLKTKVLPQVPYGKAGDAHNSIILYLRELENILGSNGAENQWYLEKEEVQDFIETIIENAPTNVEKYKVLNEEYNNLKEVVKLDKYKDNSILTDLISCVLCWRNNVFGQFAPEGWTVYCASNYITFYPTRWKEKYGGTTTSCIHFILKPWHKSDKVIQINLDIHNSACKTYLIKDKQLYEKHYDELMNHTNGISLATQDFNNNFDQTQAKFEKSKKYEWHLSIDSKSIGKKWDPQNPKLFFQKFVELEEIQKLVDYIDKNFQKD